MLRFLPRLLACLLLLTATWPAAAQPVNSGVPLSGQETVILNQPNAPRQVPVSVLMTPYYGPCDVLSQQSGGTAYCSAAHSMTRRMFASYTGPLFQLQRFSDLQVQDIGTLANGAVNIAAANSFCLGTSCAIVQIYDLTGNNTKLPVVVQSFAAATQYVMAPWTISRLNGLPYVETSGTNAGYSNRPNVSNMPTGSTSSAGYEVIMTDTWSDCCGEYGRMQDPQASNCATITTPTCAGGSAFVLAYSTYSRPTTAAATTLSTPGLGVGIEFAQYTYLVPTVPSLAMEFAKYDNSTGSITNEYSDATKTTAPTVSFQGQPAAAMNVQHGLGLGYGGDSSTGPMQFFEGAVITGAPAQTVINALQLNLSAFYGAQATPPQTIADTAVKTGAVSNNTYLDPSNMVNGAYGFRRLRQGYTGYAARLYRDSDAGATFLDVGFTPTGDFDDATAQAWCANTTCYGYWYNQALFIKGNYTKGSTQDLSVNNAFPVYNKYPSVSFNTLNGRTVFVFSGNQYMCNVGTYGTIAASYGVAAVAERTGSFTSEQLVFNANNVGVGLGYFTSTSTAEFTMGTANRTTATATDSAWHSLIGTAITGTATLIVDNGTPQAASITVNSIASIGCIGAANNGGSRKLVGQVAEVETFNTPVLTAAQITAIYTNQSNYYGKQF